MRASAVGLSPSPARVTMLRSQSRSYDGRDEVHGSSSTIGRRRTAVRFRSCSRSAACRTTCAWSTDAASSSSRAFSRSRPTSCRPAIRSRRPDGAPISFSSPARSCNISRARAAVLGGDAPREQVAVSEWLFWQMARTRADGGAGPSFSPLRAREDPLRDRSRYERGQSPIRRHERASGEPRGVPVGRVPG